MKGDCYYKAANPQGWDFYSGNTINYAENVGRTVKVPNYNANPVLRSNSVLHAFKDPLSLFIDAKIPCRIFMVEGKPVVDEEQKYGFKELTIIKEIPQAQLNDLFGFNYLEASKPIDPFKVKPGKVTDEQIELLQNWVSVWDLVWDSAGGSVGDSVGASVGNSIWETTWYPVWDSVKATLGDSFWDSIWDSVMAQVWGSIWNSVGPTVRGSVYEAVKSSMGDSFWAYIGSLFPKIKQWKYTEKLNFSGYPFQSAVDLWRQGFVPSFDKITWRLHAGSKGSVVFEIDNESIRKLELSKQLEQTISPKKKNSNPFE